MKTAFIIMFIFLGQAYNIELAITPIEQATGLMYRKEWTEKSQGMLFINKTPRQVSFWMKNTYLPLTMYYLDKNFNILEINHPIPLDENGIISKSDQVQYIFELNPKLEIQVTKNWKEFSKLLKQQLKEKEISKIKN
ncbi:MAG: DUF192 domain-containing protein [Spirochaetota bacterium]|nr:DUF192 domain-containing protein [Spirochaetota bacterium]